MPQIILLLMLAQATTLLRVTDPWNLPIPNARVQIGEFSGRTDVEGVIAIPGDLPDPLEIRVDVAGFDPHRESVPRWTGIHALRLSLAGLASGITVTATRSERLADDIAPSVTVLDASAIRTSPARAVDDMLRQVPGFSLLRRTSSVAAHPGSQGVSMRGVGANGASRTLVLADGIPLNDPFASWVYWNRIPKYAIDSIEVVRGGASDLYGSSALGGVVHIRTRRLEPDTVAGEIHYGNHGQIEGSIYASDVFRNWGFAVASEAFRTDGYKGVPSLERGPVDDLREPLREILRPFTFYEAPTGTVDGPLASAYRSSMLQIERRFSQTSRIFTSLHISTEDRKNGTPLRRNDTNYRQVSLGTEFSHRFGKTIYQAYAGSESFNSSFSTLLLNRAFEVLDLDQTVPLGYGGVDGSTVLAFKRHTIVTGVGFHYTRGVSHDVEHLWSGPLFNSNGGTQRTASVFFEDAMRLHPRTTLTLSSRWDYWRNTDLYTTKHKTYSRWSPRLALTFRLAPSLSLHAGAYGAFRAPTLNELYRPFKVNDVTTLANPLLRDERLRGLDLGLEGRAIDGRFHVRVAGYWSEIHDTVANITIALTDQATVRQRQNLGVVRAQGVEVEVETHPVRAWAITGSYLFSDSRVRQFPDSRVLVLPNEPPVSLGDRFDLQGLRVPQVPRHQVSFSARGTYTHYRLQLQGRSSGTQFEDDRNTLALVGFSVLDAFLARSIGHGAEIFAAGENLTNTSIQVAKTPITTYGSPRSFRVGISFQLGNAGADRF